jgi:hypothetical protein
MATHLVAGDDPDVSLSHGAATTDLNSVGEAGLRRLILAEDLCLHLEGVRAEVLAGISADSVSQDDVRPEVAVKSRQVLDGILFIYASVYAFALLVVHNQTAST